MLGVPAGAGNRNRSCSADRSVHGRSVWVVPRSLLHSARLLGRARLGRRAIARARRAGGVPHADGRGPAASVAWFCCWRGLTCLRYIFSWHVQFRITVTVLIVRLSSQRGDSCCSNAGVDVQADLLRAVYRTCSALGQPPPVLFFLFFFVFTIIGGPARAKDVHISGTYCSNK